MPGLFRRERKVPNYTADELEAFVGLVVTINAGPYANFKGKVRGFRTCHFRCLSVYIPALKEHKWFLVSELDK